jgi:hypothetical protein
VDFQPLLSEFRLNHPAVQIIMAHPQGNALVDRLKFMILERMGKERSERDKIIAVLIDSLSPDSLESVRSDVKFDDMRSAWTLGSGSCSSCD